MLVITVRNEESFRISHEGHELWIQLKKHHGKIRVYVDGSKDLQVLRSNHCRCSPAGNVEPATSEMPVDSAGAVSA